MTNKTIDDRSKCSHYKYLPRSPGQGILFAISNKHLVWHQDTGSTLCRLLQAFSRLSPAVTVFLKKRSLFRIQGSCFFGHVRLFKKRIRLFATGRLQVNSSSFKAMTAREVHPLPHSLSASDTYLIFDIETEPECVFTFLIGVLSAERYEQTFTASFCQAYQAIYCFFSERIEYEAFTHCSYSYHAFTSPDLPNFASCYFKVPTSQTFS